MELIQGDVFWVDTNKSIGPETGSRCPYVVIQNNVFNFSRMTTVILCALTDNLKMSQLPGNVLLSRGEANLPDRRVVNVTDIITVDKLSLWDRSGTLSRTRMREILKGIRLVMTPRTVQLR